MRFRKKPVEIEAWQFKPRHIRGHWRHEAPPDWLTNSKRKVIFTQDVDAMPVVEIQTLEGTMVASAEDWIIKGVAGEIYPCKPNIFAATYEPVES